MKRHFPGLHAEAPRGDGILEGVFLVRVDRAYYRWHPQKPFFILSFAILEPSDLTSQQSFGTNLLHPEVALETELVSSGLRLRHGPARPRRGG